MGLEGGGVEVGGLGVLVDLGGGGLESSGAGGLAGGSKIHGLTIHNALIRAKLGANML